MRNKAILGTIFIVLAICSIIIVKGQKQESNDSIEKFELEDMYYIGDTVEYGNYIIELSRSMYYEKLKTGFCIFEIKNKDGNTSQLSNFSGGVTVKGSGSMSSDKELVEDTLFVYLSFSMDVFSNSYENKVLFVFPNEDIIEFELDNTVNEELVLNDHEKNEVIISSIGIWINEDSIDYMKFIYKDGDEETIIENGTLVKESYEIQNARGGILISVCNPIDKIMCSEIAAAVINEEKIQCD